MYLIRFRVIGGRMEGFEFVERADFELRVHRVYHSRAPKGVGFECLSCEKIA